jgi:chemotaxis family two-component system sensor kinase Cph1
MSAGSVNLDTCDREPIHLIGAVQPHGALIVLDDATHQIDYVSTNVQAFVGLPPEALLGQPVTRVLGEANAAQLRRLPLDPAMPELLKPWFITLPGAGSGAPGIPAECLPHRNNGHVLLEFMRPEDSPAPVWEDEYLRRGFISELLKSSELDDVAAAAARIIRDVTGFDRVMIYRFAEDKHGEVIAESTSRPDSFLGLHYPASDIPDPARRHFRLNLMRSIPDINGTRVPIVGRGGVRTDAASPHPLDLTFSRLRAVAPVHVEYLNNMGVAGSLSISLVANDRLWGLIACHHYAPRLVPSSRVRFAELVGGTTASLLQSIENTNHLRRSIEAEKTAFRIEQEARSGRPFRALVSEWADRLMELVDAQGMILRLGGETLGFGRLPPRPLDFGNLRRQVAEGIATTAQLSSVVLMDEDQLQAAAGAAMIELSDDGRDSLVFLRGHYEQTIQWAGKPDKVETRTEGGLTRLSPRGSFALWSEERRGQSKPFDARDREALRILRRALFALNSLEHERAAREAQRAAEAEEARLRHALLDASSASSMGELASAIVHELNQPLYAISNFVTACRKELENAGIVLPERAAMHFDSAVLQTTRAGDLLQRVRNFISAGDLNADYVDLTEAIRQGVNLALVAAELPDLQVSLMLDRRLPRVFADPVQIGQVVLNLCRNSIAAMRDTPRRRLTVEAVHDDESVRVFVRDTGPGIAPEQRQHLFEPFHTSTTRGMGIGLSLCRSIVEAHGGRIWAERLTKGAVFVFQLPIHGARGE